MIFWTAIAIVLIVVGAIIGGMLGYSERPFDD